MDEIFKAIPMINGKKIATDDGTFMDVTYLDPSIGRFHPFDTSTNLEYYINA